MNELRHRRRLTTWQDRNVVSPNNDTVYSNAWLDLTREPVMLHTPAARGRYCSYAFYDAWTNNFRVVSARTSRDADADYAITGPQWKGVLPKGVTRIESPTNTVWLLIRTLIVDEQDWPGVIALQDGMKLAPLSEWRSKATAVKAQTVANAQTTAATKPPAANSDPLAFFEQMGALLRRDPPPVSDAAFLDQFALIGLSVKDGFAAERLDAATRAGLLRAIPAARKMLATMKGDQALRRAGGWLLVTRGGAFGDEYLFRALVAEKGLAQLVPEEASYLTTDMDGDGQPLNGANKYILRFPKGQAPPAHSFWSLTLYAADFFFVENPINRYALGDRTRGLKYDADGGLTIYLQHEAPPGNESNWLPAPRGDFNLNLRAYLPKPELLNNSYQPPAVQRVK
ncbi:MAG: hypothetical protein JMDDDDMK_01767 [Acidobacteria bacterium]|nr:hypothetical protein [Acidobacteriota bacterium]